MNLITGLQILSNCISGFIPFETTSAFAHQTPSDFFQSFYSNSFPSVLEQNMSGFELFLFVSSSHIRGPVVCSTLESGAIGLWFGLSTASCRVVPHWEGPETVSFHTLNLGCEVTLGCTQTYATPQWCRI